MTRNAQCQDTRTKTDLHILVVGEDDDMLCSVSNLLNFHGYQCRTAISGAEAIDVIQESKIDMIITDQNLSDLTGRQLNNYVKKLCPDTEVIIIDQSDRGYRYQKLNAA
ncbi:MAG: response regulator [Desulfurivibrionaceae bacterium]